MTNSTVTEFALGLAVVVYLCVKQLTWRPVDPVRMWRMPLLLGAAGIYSLTRESAAVHPVDVLILGLSAVCALASGALMGRIARFRPSPADPAVLESRAGWRGVAIWFGLIVVRVGLDVAGHRMGSDLALATGSILLVVALNRFSNALVLSARQPRRAFAMAGK